MPVLAAHAPPAARAAIAMFGVERRTAAAGVYDPLDLLGTPAIRNF